MYFYIIWFHNILYLLELLHGHIVLYLLLGTPFETHGSSIIVVFLLEVPFNVG